MENGITQTKAWEPVGFESGFGPKGLGNLAQALAWVASFLCASPVRAPDNAGAIHIDRTQIQMTISSAPAGLVAFIITPTQAKAWAEFPWPFGPKTAIKSDILGRSPTNPSRISDQR